MLARTEAHLTTLRRLCAPRNIQIVLLVTQIDKYQDNVNFGVQRLLRSASLTTLRDTLQQRYGGLRTLLLRNNLESSLSSDVGTLVWHSLKTIVDAGNQSLEIKASKK